MDRLEVVIVVLVDLGGIESLIDLSSDPRYMTVRLEIRGS